MLTSALSSWRPKSSYRRLLDCGVEIWNYQPTMLHAKAITVDGLVASVGSANFNTRSMRCDEEINLVVIDEGVVSALDADFEMDLDAANISSGADGISGRSATD